MEYRFIETLKLKYKVRELEHAFRINGIVDIYKIGGCVYSVSENKYYKKLSQVQIESTVLNQLSKYVEKEDFKKNDGKMTYQEFKHIRKEERYTENSSNGEDYYWKINVAVKGEDHLYFAIIDDKVKIGRSKNPKERILGMKTAMYKKPIVWVFRNKGFMERKLHEYFADFRLNGEWFTLSARVNYFLTKYHNSKTGYKLNPVTLA